MEKKKKPCHGSLGTVFYSSVPFYKPLSGIWRFQVLYTFTNSCSCFFLEIAKSFLEFFIFKKVCTYMFPLSAFCSTVIYILLDSSEILPSPSWYVYICLVFVDVMASLSLVIWCQILILVSFLQCLIPSVLWVLLSKLMFFLSFSFSLVSLCRP